MDFAEELGSTLQVVPVGHQWSATPTHSDVETLRWTNAHGYVAMDGSDLSGRLGPCPPPGGSVRGLHAVVRRSRSQQPRLSRQLLRFLGHGLPRPEIPWRVGQHQPAATATTASRPAVRVVTGRTPPEVIRQAAGHARPQLISQVCHGRRRPLARPRSPAR